MIIEVKVFCLLRHISSFAPTLQNATCVELPRATSSSVTKPNKDWFRRRTTPAEEHFTHKKHGRRNPSKRYPDPPSCIALSDPLLLETPSDAPPAPETLRRRWIKPSVSGTLCCAARVRGEEVGGQERRGVEGGYGGSGGTNHVPVALAWAYAQTLLSPGIFRKRRGQAKRDTPLPRHCHEQGTGHEKSVNHGKVDALDAQRKWSGVVTSIPGNSVGVYRQKRDSSNRRCVLSSGKSPVEKAGHKESTGKPVEDYLV